MSAPKTPKPNAAQIRLTRVIETLAGNEYSGIRLKDITAAVGEKHPPTVLHDLEALESVGWAKRIETDHDRWILAARPVQVLHNFYEGIRTAHARADALTTNYTRLPV